MLVFSFFAASVQMSAVQAEDASQKKQNALKSESESLFDGKTLGHWVRGDYGDEGQISVEDESLIIGKGRPITAAVWKGPELPKSNYELTFEARRIEGNDFFAAATFPYQKSACTLVLGGWGGGLIGLSSLNGIDASENPTTGYKEFKQGQWYKIKIRVTDDRIVCSIDGEVIADVSTEENEIDVRIEMVGCRPLGFASYRTKGAVRKIELTRLPPPEKK